jgi:hypothetical protein
MQDFWQISLYDFCRWDSINAHPAAFALFFKDTALQIILSARPKLHLPFRDFFGLTGDSTLGDYLKISDSY